MRLIVAVTGASGVIYGKRLLEELRERKIETHLIVSEAAERVIRHELRQTRKDFERLATHTYDEHDLEAPPMSGSFQTDGMIVVPCTMKTLAGIASGYADSLILKAADVTIKEHRKLVIVPRESPISMIHLRNMLTLAELGAFVVPAMPAYYHNPKKIDDLVDFIVGKILDCLGIEHKLYKRWKSP